MKKTVFVILHYLSIDDTCECIDSIKRCCEGESYQIVVVDNASPNKTGEELADKYNDDPDVDVLILNENLGFARGNNEGISFARKNYDPLFIIALNNDIMLLQKETIEIVEKEYEKSKFAVLGPIVYFPGGNTSGYHGMDRPRDLDNVNMIIDGLKKEYIVSKWRLEKIYNILTKRKLEQKVYEKKEESMAHEYPEKKYNMELYGCFLCFSKEYFKAFDGFFPNTFMYMEEDIMFYLTQREHLITVYDPELKVLHKCGQASNAAWPRERKRKLNQIRFALNSAKAFKKLLLEDKNRKTGK